MQPIHTFTHATSLQEICSNKRFASTRKPCTTEIYNEFSSSFVQGFHDIPHANIHSCIASRGACTPFVANTPGLATHTAAQTANFSQTGLVTFDTKVKLPKGQYKIIAHIRFFHRGDYSRHSQYEVGRCYWHCSRNRRGRRGGMVCQLFSCLTIIGMCCMNFIIYFAS